MSDSIYTRDLRVVWWPDAQCFTVATGADPPPAVFQRLDRDGMWMASWDCEPMPADSTNPDEVIAAIIGDPVDAGDAVQILSEAVVHGAWSGPPFEATDALVAAGLLVQDDEAFWPTATGAAKAAMLAGEG